MSFSSGYKTKRLVNHLWGGDKWDQMNPYLVTFSEMFISFSPLLFMGETLKGNRIRNGAKTDVPEGVASVSSKIDAQRYHL